MAPSDYRAGTTIKPKQKKKIEDDGYLKKWGKQVRKASKAHTGEKKDLQKGTAQDDISDAVSPHTDLSRIGMGSEVGDPIISGVINLSGLPPKDGPINSTYILNFDTDRSFDGPEQMLVIDVWGDQSHDPILNTQAHLIDHSGYDEFVPVPIILTTGIRAVDLDVPAEPVELQLEFQLEKFLLTGDSEPGIIPIVAESFDNLLSDESARPDELQFEFDGEWFVQQPDLLLGEGQALPGDTIPFEIVGLSLASSFDLFIDETPLLFSGSTDDYGNFIGDFMLPDVELDEFHFVTAIDEYGVSAFNVIHSILELLIGDANFDGIVDVADLGILGANFNADDMQWNTGDFNLDGMTDVADLGILGANWSASQATGNASALVPEPATLSLLTVSVLLVGRRRR